MAQLVGVRAQLATAQRIEAQANSELVRAQLACKRAELAKARRIEDTAKHELDITIRAFLKS